MLQINPKKFKNIENKSIPSPLRPKLRNKAETNIYFLSKRKFLSEKKKSMLKNIKFISGIIILVIGGYFLTNFLDTTVRLGDTLVIICALFWSLHIIFIGIIIEEFNAPILIGLIQTFVVSVCSLIPGLIFEEFVLVDILSQKIQILYAGVLSGGIAFVLQIYAQKNIQPAPSAIIFSLEGVFATAAAWIILSQILNFNNILGCTFILIGVLISQLVPEIKKN